MVDLDYLPIMNSFYIQGDFLNENQILRTFRQIHDVINMIT
jgi:hypothetical protein